MAHLMSLIRVAYRNLDEKDYWEHGDVTVGHTIGGNASPPATTISVHLCPFIEKSRGTESHSLHSLELRKLKTRTGDTAQWQVLGSIPTTAKITSQTNHRKLHKYWGSFSRS